MINVKEINPCDPQIWTNRFKQSPLYQKILPNYKHVISSHREMTFLKAALNHTVYEIPRRFCDNFGILDVIPYYYIEQLMEINPKDMVDIGCGQNVFKKTYPNLLGIDCETQHSCPDIVDYFDEDFCRGHAGWYDAVITINTIHFEPINTIADRILMVNQLLRPGGRAFVAFNFETWLMHTPKDQCVELFGNFPKFDDVINYVNDQIISTKLNFLTIDWPILRVTQESTIRDDYNGNIRLVFEHD